MENVRMFYARVSSKEQNEARQLEEARQFGIEERLIFLDKASGANFDREQFKAMLAFMRSGEEVYIASRDRLGRNYRETAVAWEYITKTKNEVIIDSPITVTWTATGLSWYATSDNPNYPGWYQNNVSGRTYYYCAIGYSNN